MIINNKINRNYSNKVMKKILIGLVSLLSVAFFAVNTTYAQEAPSITVLSPNGGENLTLGQDYTIRWSSANLPADAKIGIYIAENETELGTTIVRDLAANETSYVWKVTSPESNPSDWHIPLGMSDTWHKITEFFGVKTANAATHSYKITVYALNVVTDMSDGSFTISSAVTPLSITTTSLPNGTVGATYNAPVTITGGSASPSPTWTTIGGQLPPGLGTYLYQGGIVGTPTTAGTYTFTQQVYQNGLFATKQFTITILPQTTATPSITLLSPNGGEVLQVGQNYTIRWSSANVQPDAKINIILYDDSNALNLVIASDLAPDMTSYTWKVVSAESNPNGWIFMGKTETWKKVAQFFGIKTAEASGHTYRIHITSNIPGSPNTPSAFDASDGSFTISSASTTLGISTTQNWMLTGTVGKAYDVPVSVTNAASSPTPTWSVVSGQLPPGLSIGASTGHITGTPTTEGTFYFTLQVSQNGSVATKQYYIQVIGAPAIRVTSPNGGENLTVGQNYTIRWTNINMPGDAKITVYVVDSVTGLGQYIARGLSTNENSYIWKVNSPDSNSSGWQMYGYNETLGQKIAKFFGIKTAEAANNLYTMQVWALDPNGKSLAYDTSNGTFTISPVAVQNPLSITTTSLLSGKVGNSYTSYINATGGTTSSSPLWTIFSGQLPPGLRLGSTGFVGYITGTPTTAGTYTFVAMISQGSLYYKKEFTITIVPTNNLVCATYFRTATSLSMVQGTWTNDPLYTSSISACYNYVKANLLDKVNCAQPNGAYITAALIDKTKHTYNMPSINMSTEYVYGGSCTQPVATASISILSPVDGEKWSVGSTHRISWKPFSGTSETYGYLIGGGHESGYLKYIGASANDSYFDYTVASSDIGLNGSGWQIAICDGKYNVNNCSFSGSIFITGSIVTAPSVTLLNPNGGEVLQVGQNYTIKWSSANLPSDASAGIILYNGTVGAPYEQTKAITTNVLASVGSYTWKVAPTDVALTNSYIMRIVVQKNAAEDLLLASDAGNGTFTISPSTTQSPLLSTTTKKTNTEDQKNINDLQARIDELKAQIEDMKRGVAVGKTTTTPSTPTTGSLPADIDTQGPQDSCADIKIDLRYRSRDVGTNDDVSLLQDFLQTSGYSSSEPTGFFGVITLRSVKAFQKANNISPTGFVGPTTRAKIKYLSCSGPHG
jgi:hypothetical protein